MLVEALDAMFEVDQLNAPNLLSAEILARRWQLIKEAHRVNPGNPNYQAPDHSMGWKHRRTGVARELTSYVAEQVKAEAGVLKEMRKAREEAEALQQQNRGRGGGGGRGRGRGADGHQSAEGK